MGVGGMVARNNIAKDFLLSASMARAFEDAYVTGLAGGVITVDYGEIRPEPKGLAFRKGIHAAVMKNGQE